MGRKTARACLSSHCIPSRSIPWFSVKSWYRNQNIRNKYILHIFASTNDRVFVKVKVMRYKNRPMLAFWFMGPEIS